MSDYLSILPEVPLKLILWYVPLSDLFRVIPLVCKRWHELQPAVLAMIKSVSLLLGHDPIGIIERSTLVTDPHGGVDGNQAIKDDLSHLKLASPIAEKADALASALIRSFLNITSLSVSISELCLCPQLATLIIRLLTTWANKLHTLKLWYRATPVEFPHIFRAMNNYTRPINHGARQKSQFSALFVAINGLSNLKRLTMDIEHISSEHGLSFELSVLSQLHEFNFNCDLEWDLKNTAYSLEKYARQNDKLVHIRIGAILESLHTTRGQDQLDSNRDMPSVLRKHFQSRVVLLSPGRVVSFARLFTSLTTLSVEIIPSTWNSIAKTLSDYLPNLVDLRIRLQFQFSLPGKGLPQNETPADQLIILPSVKMLTLQIATSIISIKGHTVVHSPIWSVAFPSVQLITIEHFLPRQPCNICFPRDRNYARYGLCTQQDVRCAQLHLTTFAACSSLKRVLYYDSPIHWYRFELDQDRREFVRAE